MNIFRASVCIGSEEYKATAGGTREGTIFMSFVAKRFGSQRSVVTSKCISVPWNSLHRRHGNSVVIGDLMHDILSPPLHLLF